MHLLSLQLENFRSYKSIELDLSKADLHLFIGPNGAGKTNLLESVSVLSLTKSFLGVEEQDLATWKSSFYRVRAAVISDSEEAGTLEVVCEISPRRKKACFFNDVSTSISKMIGRLPTVTFLPQDLDLFTGSPQNRRRFLDQLLCQVSPEYLHQLSAYQKVLKQRNALLRTICKERAFIQSIEPWNQKLAELGSSITLARLELIETLNRTFLEELGSLSESFESGSMIYRRRSESLDKAELTQEFLSLFEHYQERDLVLQSTTVGPHRDDWCIELDGRPLPTFASRGQQRVCVLAVLLLQASYLELRKNEKPIILLDDVFSELDDAHQEVLLTRFGEHQVLVTATRTPPMPEHLPHHQVWEFHEGQTSVRAYPVPSACPPTHPRSVRT